MNTPSARAPAGADHADVEEPSDGLDAEDIKFLRSLRTSATPGPSMNMTRWAAFQRYLDHNGRRGGPRWYDGRDALRITYISHRAASE